MPTTRRIGLGAVAMAVALLLGGVASATPALAAEVEDPAAVVLSEIRSNLVAFGSAADVSAFDELDAEQREELASYFLDASAAEEVASEARVTRAGATTVRTNGDFEWGETEVTPVASKQGGAVALAAASRTTWGTQWFAFAGIKLTETKVSMTYEYSGTTAKKMLGYACTVVTNTQPFTEVKTSKSSAFISGGKATAKCKVVTKRGVVTPWGTIAWSTYEGVQRLTAKGNGEITFNGWE